MIRNKPDFIPQELHDSLVQSYIDGLIRYYSFDDSMATIELNLETKTEKKIKIKDILIKKYKIQDYKITLNFNRVEIRK